MNKQSFGQVGRVMAVKKVYLCRRLNKIDLYDTC
jgi:hypothetical protein